MVDLVATVVAEVVAAKAAAAVAAVAAVAAGVMAATVEAMGVVAVRADSEVDLKAAFPTLRVDRKLRYLLSDNCVYRCTRDVLIRCGNSRTCSTKP